MSVIDRCSLVDRLDRRLQKQAIRLRTCMWINSYLISLPQLDWMNRYQQLRHLIVGFASASYIPPSVRSAITTLQLSFVPAEANMNAGALTIVAMLYPIATTVEMWSEAVEVGSSLCVSYSLGSREECDNANVVPTTQVAWMTSVKEKVIEHHVRMLILDYTGEAPVLQCESLVTLHTISISEASRLPQLEVLVLDYLPEKMNSITLPRLRSLHIRSAGVTDLELYRLQRFSPSLKSLQVESMLAVTLLTSRLPHTLTELYIDGMDSPRVILDPTLPLTRLGLYQCELAGVLPSTLVDLRTDRLSMSEVSHCHHLKRLTCEPGLCGEEWPSTLTYLNVGIKPPYALPPTLPPRIRHVTIRRTNATFPYPLTGLLTVRFNGVFTAEQLSQFRGKLLASNNTDDELRAVSIVSPRAAIWKYSR